MQLHMDAIEQAARRDMLAIGVGADTESRRDVQAAPDHLSESKCLAANEFSVFVRYLME